MGFITTTNNSGKEVFACEIGKEHCNTFPCRAHKCPFNWCQRYYVCNSCWQIPEVKESFTKSAHSFRGCERYSKDFAKKEQEQKDLKSQGFYIRCSALAVDNVDPLNVYNDTVVHVLFRGINGDCKGLYMLGEVYDAFPLGVNVTMEDFIKKAIKLKLAIPVDAPDVFEHTKEITI